MKYKVGDRVKISRPCTCGNYPMSAHELFGTYQKILNTTKGGGGRIEYIITSPHGPPSGWYICEEVFTSKNILHLCE